MIQKKFHIVLLVLILLGVNSQIFSQSPYRIDLVKESIILGSGLGIFGIAYPINSNLEHLTVEEINLLNRDNVNSFDRGATYNWSTAEGNVSDLLVGASILSPTLFAFSEKVRNDFAPVLTMYIETLIFSEALPSIMKGITKRTRPFAYNEVVPLDEKQTKNARRSFFSGHSTAAFSMAVFVSTVYSDYYPNSSWKPYVWAGTLTLATAVGILRYSSGSHFPTDIITGALVGSAIGYLIPFIHRKENSNINISLGLNQNGRSVIFTYKF